MQINYLENKYSKLEPPTREAMTLKEELQLQAIPQLGNVTKASVRIHENKEFKMIIEKMAQNANSSVVQENFSWSDQFKEAISLREDDNDDDDPPSCGEYIMHFLTVIWKVLFAFVPPTEYKLQKVKRLRRSSTATHKSRKLIVSGSHIHYKRGFVAT
ncbi:hypothetical protein RUM43_007827 [Polyplax serrata]|uniref:Uncharacterized protein n=1 Tax=Polyplax serrata TaxID=468196 RepID=A0AAN8P6G3_POLSC